MRADGFNVVINHSMYLAPGIDEHIQERAKPADRAACISLSAVTSYIRFPVLSGTASGV
jgi:hypothetical protein